jgi:hypothetical protein
MSLIVRLLPPLAAILGVIGLVVARDLATTITGGGLIACALVLELRGWGRSVHRDGRRLGIAAIGGALFGAATLGVLEQSQSPNAARIAVRSAKLPLMTPGD